MDITTCLISVYSLIDEWLEGKRIRQRGPQPRLSDNEVLTIEVVGEFLGIDTEAAEEISQAVQGWALADRNYWKPDWQLALREQGLFLQVPFKSTKRQTFHYPHWLVEKRYRIETVFGQSVERFPVKKVWARDAWHFTSRWWRNLLSHLFSVLFLSAVGFVIFTLF